MADRQRRVCDNCGETEATHLTHAGEPAYLRQASDDGAVEPDRCGDWTDPKQPSPQPDPVEEAARQLYSRCTCTDGPLAGEVDRIDCADCWQAILRDLVSQVREEERERAARLVEAEARPHCECHERNYGRGDLFDIAAAIRARGEGR